MTDTHPPIPLSEAESKANEILDSLIAAGVLVRASVAGSIRRRKPQVHDLEVVGAPKMVQNPQSIVDELVPDLSGIKRVLAEKGWVRGPPNKAGAVAPWGPRYLKAQNAEGIQLDLFLTYEPAVWPVNYLIRTGSASFSTEFVTRLHRWGLRSTDGHLEFLAGGKVALILGTEEELFRLNHLPYLEPEKRDMDLPETKKLFA